MRNGRNLSRRRWTTLDSDSRPCRWGVKRKLLTLANEFHATDHKYYAVRMAISYSKCSQLFYHWSWGKHNFRKRISATTLWPCFQLTQMSQSTLNEFKHWHISVVLHILMFVCLTVMRRRRKSMRRRKWARMVRSSWSVVIKSLDPGINPAPPLQLLRVSLLHWYK